MSTDKDPTKKEKQIIELQDCLEDIRSIYFDPEHLPISLTVPKRIKEWAQEQAKSENITLSKYITLLVFNDWIAKNLPKNHSAEAVLQEIDGK